VSLDIIKGALEDLDRLREKLVALRTKVENSSEMESDQPIKNKKGNLTATGIAKLRELYDAGHGPSDIARLLDVSPSAVIYQRNLYLSERQND
jgi:hypothetical protein